jgi:hypothetical protein
MKTKEEVEDAINKLCPMMMQRGISIHQYSVLVSLITALCWVVEKEYDDCDNVVDRLLSEGYVFTSEIN